VVLSIHMAVIDLAECVALFSEFQFNESFVRQASLFLDSEKQ
jgi:hypothetical protein